MESRSWNSGSFLKISSSGAVFPLLKSCWPAPDIAPLQVNESYWSKETKRTHTTKVYNYAYTQTQIYIYIYICLCDSICIKFLCLINLRFSETIGHDIINDSQDSATAIPRLAAPDESELLPASRPWPRGAQYPETPSAGESLGDWVVERPQLGRYRYMIYVNKRTCGFHLPKCRFYSL